jgi:hypothetical protein
MVGHLVFAEETLGMLGKEVMHAHLMQHGPHVVEMFCPRRTEYQNIIKKTQAQSGRYKASQYHS